jgi:YVTN family beta-propeller protein
MEYAASTTYVYNCSGDAQSSIEVIATRDDAATVGTNEQHTIVQRIPLAARCGYLHVDTAEHAYLTIGGTNQLARIRLADHVVETFGVCDGPDKLEIVGTRAYVSCTEEPSVAVVDLTGVAATFEIAVGNAKDPASTDRAHRGIRHDGDLLFVPNAFDGTVSVIDATTDTVVRTWAGMDHPSNIAVAGLAGGTTYPR